MRYEVLKSIPQEKRPSHVEEVFREANVRFPKKKSRYLTKNVEIVREMGGLKAAREKALSQPDAEAKIEFVKRFKGIRDKYGRNFWMDVRHPDFENKVALDQRIGNITELLGRQFESYEAEEQFYLEIAEEAGLTGWELDRLLYNFTDHFRTVVKKA